MDETRDWQPSPFDSLDKPKTLYRPIRLTIWYPAEKGQTDFMKFENYINPEAPDKYFEKLNEVMNTYDMWSYNGMFDKNKTIIDSLFNLETNATFNAKEMDGKFPVVLYCCGWFSRSPDNSFMAEYLASLGYIVITVPQLGTGSTIFDFKVTEDRLYTQVQDMKFALDAAVKLNNADPDNIAVMGFSIGGIVQLWLSQLDDRVKALIALDGSFMFKEWEELSKKGIIKEKKNFPILSLYRGHEKLASNISTDFYKSLPSVNKILIAIPKATHGEFSDEAYLYSKLNYPWKHSEYNNLDEALNCYISVIKTSAAFLDIVLTNDNVNNNLSGKMKKIAEDLQLEYIF
ncbi:MAG: prolyl oligopeptidase family serine peptidase [Ignavibacteria bacterium]